MSSKLLRTTTVPQRHYQKALNMVFLDDKSGKFIQTLVLNNFLTGTPSLWVIWFIKYTARPCRKFLNSTSTVPPPTLVNQCFNFPLPFPIREAGLFLLSGRWGKALNQANRRVLSPFLADFLIKVFKCDKRGAVK